MKPFYFFSVSIFLFFFCNNLNGQNSIGVRAGIFAAKINYFTNDKLTTDSDPLYGIDVGLIANFKIEDWLSFEPEINFLQKGGTVPDYPFSPAPKTYYRQMESVVPIKIELPAKKIRFYIKGGWTFGYMINGYDIGASSTKYKVDFSEPDSKRLDIGVMCSSGVGLSFNRSKIYINGIFRKSFLYTTNKGLEDFSASTKNKGLGVYLSYFIIIEDNK